MNIPDYISPIVGYRTWQWDSFGLKSLNNERWFPEQPLEAKCRDFPLICGPDAPQERCSCGIYAAKNAEHLVEIGYMRRDEVHGEVYLWGKVVEHSHGYRAQFAYPKTIMLPRTMVPNADELESHLKALTSYGVDISIVAPSPDLAMGAPLVKPPDIPLWSKASGFGQAGLDWIAERQRLRHRCAIIFEIHKGMAFAGRNDQFFIETWTPDTAAAPYQFDTYKITGDQITLYGNMAKSCLIYTISISFPFGLIDNIGAIGDFLRHESERNRAKREQERAASRRISN